MSISMHKASAPVFLRMLSNLDQFLEKADANAKQRGFDPNLLVNQRLAPDMLTLAGQIQRASDASKFTIARLSGVDGPSFPDTETTIDQLRTRIANTIDYIKSVPASAVDGSEERQVILKLPSGDIPFTGLNYLTAFAIPNFLFHVTTAYAILRHSGVPLGKADFIGRP